MVNNFSSHSVPEDALNNPGFNQLVRQNLPNIVASLSKYNPAQPIHALKQAALGYLYNTYQDAAKPSEKTDLPALFRQAAATVVTGAKAIFAFGKHNYVGGLLEGKKVIENCWGILDGTYKALHHNQILAIAQQQIDARFPPNSDAVNPENPSYRRSGRFVPAPA